MLLPSSPSSAAPGGGTPATAAVNAIANQTAPGTVTAGVTLPGGETPSAYAWRLNGSTTGISDPTAAAPTITFSQPGTYTLSCALTIGANTVDAAPASFRLGDGQILPTRFGASASVIATA